MASDEQGQRDVGSMGIELFMPAASAFRTGRIIAGHGFARIAKAHRENGDLARVVELLRRQTCPPGTPQLLCRPIDQPGDFAIKPGQVRASQTVVSAAVWTETRGRLARVLASRCNVDRRSHRLAGSAMR